MANMETCDFQALKLARTNATK